LSSLRVVASLAWSALGASCLVPLLGCGDIIIPATADGGTDTATGDAGAREPSAAARAVSCQTFPITGKKVAMYLRWAPAPTPTGGTIADGTYELDSYDIYAGPPDSNQVDAPVSGAPAYAEVLRVTGGTTWYTGADYKDPPSYRAGIWQIDGTTLVEEVGCPVPSTNPVGGYDATSTTLTIYVGDGAGAHVRRYVRKGT
jgi:hypothetical protein